jgi:hypothetical protein
MSLYLPSSSFFLRPAIVDVNFISPVQNFAGEPHKRRQVHRIR